MPCPAYPASLRPGLTDRFRTDSPIPSARPSQLIYVTVYDVKMCGAVLLPPGVSGLIRKLLSGEQSKIIEALRAIIAAAAKNPKFAREFNRWAGGGAGSGEAGDRSCRVGPPRLP